MHTPGIWEDNPRAITGPTTPDRCVTVEEYCEYHKYCESQGQMDLPKIKHKAIAIGMTTVAIAVCGNGISREEMLCNARLIANAPYMLDLLKEIVPFLEKGLPAKHEIVELIEKLSKTPS